jgi:hypothetical protein
MANRNAENLLIPKRFALSPQSDYPRSAEARKQADQLRLEHFVWE